LLCSLNHIDNVFGIEAKETINDEQQIACLHKGKRNFKVKVKEFVKEVEIFRKNGKET